MLNIYTYYVTIKSKAKTRIINTPYYPPPFAPKISLTPPQEKELKHYDKQRGGTIPVAISRSQTETTLSFFSIKVFPFRA